MPITFKVDDVKLATSLIEIITAKELVSHNTKSKIEACLDIELVKRYTNINGFLAAAHMAFDEHRPLSISPDSVWLTIANGLATHINLNAEELRYQFVNHEGKKKIIIRRDHFVKGNPENDWEGCFDEFSNKLADYIGKKRDLIVSSFSTTGTVEKAASEVVLMDAMQSYFEYGMVTACGFPRITLEGAVKDWKDIVARVKCFNEFGLGWWTEHLIPVLDRIVETASGNVDKDFWQSFLKINGGSGGPFVTGWINTLFPYLNRKRKNNSIDGKFGYRADEYPIGLSSVPFEWEYFSTVYNMNFVGGVIGVSQAEDLTLRPEIGWAVAEEQI